MLALCAVMLYGCAPTHAQRYSVKVKPATPVMKVRPPMPGAGHIWVNGEWVWNGRGYVWKEGYWLSPRVGYQWVPGHWKRERGGWYWIEGHWR